MSPNRLIWDFSRYPYPFIDPLGLDVNRVAYLKPNTYSDSWLTALGRLQTSLSQLAGSRDLDARIIETPDETEWGDRIIAIGQPKNQPLFKDLELPFDIKDNRILDGDGKPPTGRRRNSLALHDRGWHRTRSDCYGQWRARGSQSRPVPSAIARSHRRNGTGAPCQPSLIGVVSGYP